MTTAPPQRDSVLDALGYAARVLGKPGFLWAPILLYVIVALPLLALPGMNGRPPPTFATQAEVESYIRTYIPTLVASLVLGIVLGPVASAVTFRLADQYIEGESPDPFGAGAGNLAWRFFLQTLVLTGVVIAFILACVIVFAVLQAIVGLGLAILLTFIAGFVAYLLGAVRIGLAPVMLLRGAGPVESIERSWQITKGQFGRVFRWFVVTFLIIGIASAVIGGVVSAFLGALGLVAVAQVLASALAAPFVVMGAIVFLLLVRLLSSPLPPPPPAAALPDWMNQTAPAPDAPATPATEGS
jgi:MFS family permease